jgi:hypothetical protein
MSFCSLESPLLWLRADPELEYLAELNLLQPEQMWVGSVHANNMPIVTFGISSASEHPVLVLVDVGVFKNPGLVLGRLQSDEW